MSLRISSAHILMRGPYPLFPQQVEIRVPPHVKGVYCLAKTRNGIKIVARTDQNLRETIKSFTHQYTVFWYEPATSDRECYDIQCRQFHKCVDTDTLESTDHPEPPKEGCTCPICGK
ncbi:MAG: hypothetical protein JSU73_11605 [candidate division WOR-3 bacterium]|nr:MAG: hypothetical protein JSU73_11605 [candidate division WOR-3 bacterium]